MLFTRHIDPARAMGRAPEQLSLPEAQALAGKFVALEVYTPKTLPLRRIEAIGDEPEDCLRQLAASGRDPLRYELTRLKAPF